MRSATLAVVASVIAWFAISVPVADAGTLYVRLGVTQAGCLAQGSFPGGMTGDAYCANPPQLPLHAGWDLWPESPSVSAGVTGEWQMNAPAGITIDSATLPSIETAGLAASSAYGWRARDYWAGGVGSNWTPGTTQASEGQDSYLNSGYFGFKLYCYASTCNNAGYVKVFGVDLTATENQGPSLLPLGNNNLWYQTGHWVWNPPGDPWSIAMASIDPSGVCNMYAVVNSLYIQGPTATPSTDRWQQCPNSAWSNGASVDTRDYVGTSGALSLRLAATNAAQVDGAASETLEVDNDPVAVSLSTPNDTNPSVWVNHPVNVDATATAGPSGVSGMNCAIDGGAAESYPAAGLTVNGDGTHNVSCEAWNRAVDPQGLPNTAMSSTTIKIDEAPPSVSIEPPDPGDPTKVVVDTSDAESGVAGGSIEMAPASTSNWTSLPTSFDGQHLLATVNDAGLHGAYTVRATSCDNVGNCATTQENLTLPLRLAATSDASFTEIQAPAVTVTKRVRIDWHLKHVRRRGKVTTVKAGGHYVTVHLVIRKNAACASARIRTGAHRWREVTACRKVRINTLASERIGFGKPATVHGLLITADGVPVVGAPVQILAAPDDGLSQFGAITTVRTDARGEWSATLPPGPSRIIHAVYSGSAVLLPATGTARTIVPAQVRLISVSPRRLPWGGTVRIVGQLDGGYLPPRGALVRLRIGAGSAYTTYGVKEHVTGTGRFSTTYTFGLGDPSVRQGYWFQIASLPMGNYPYAPADSQRVRVVVGGHP